MFFSDIPDTPRTCVTFDMFISDISDIQQLIYLCTFSGRSAFLQEMCPSTRVLFFRIFRTLRRPVLHLTYLFHIFRIFSTSLICACSGSSAFFQDIYLSTRAVFFGYSGHSKDMDRIWYINFEYFGHSAAHLFVHILLVLRKFRIVSGHVKYSAPQFTWAH